MFFRKKNLLTVDIIDVNEISGMFMVHGWVASNEPIGKIDIDDNGALYEGQKVARADVEKAHGKNYKYITGFRQEIVIFAAGAAHERHIRVSAYNASGVLIGKQERRETFSFNAEYDSDRPALLFIHIPKTAGTTMRSIFSKLYKKSDIYSIYEKSNKLNDIDDFNELSDEEKSKVRLFTGHVPYGLHKSIPQAIRYFTLMREPIGRVISFFQHAANNKNHNDYKLINDTKMSLAEFIKRGLAVQVDNYQTQQLSGISADFGECSQEMLETAKRNIEENIAVVGLTERFDESLVLMKREFGWGDVFYKRQNIAKKVLPRADVTDELIDIVRQHNLLDMELYQFAEERLERQIAEQGASFADELQEFKRANAIGGKS